jgi:hypothetical protein
MGFGTLQLMLFPCGLSHMSGWSEPAATNAPFEDEAVEAVLGMNQNHILPAQIYIFFPASTLPQNISLLPTYLLPTSPLLPSITIARARAGALEPEREWEHQSPSFHFQASR